MKEFNFEKTNQELMEFLDNSPSSFHAVANMKAMLEEAGCSCLLEGEKWQLEPGKGYYVTRNDSALIAFRIPKKDFTGFQVMASHSDSPVFKVKANAEIEVEKHYVKLNVEKYGGMICSPWLDRPLSVAGRIVVKTADGVETRLVKVDRDLLIIPNLAIHMNRSVNDGYEFNAQKDMLPLFCGGGQEKGSFLAMIAAEAGVEKEDILDTDLFLYNRDKGTTFGLNGEYIASPHLDDLQCAFSSLKGFLAAEPKDSVAVHCVMDNEEVGSGTKADPTNRPYLNEGIVIKYSANQKYTTDAVSGALFKAVCQQAEVPFQTFHNRSDMLGGSTLGNISGNQVAFNTVDIGLPQLAMHSCFETAGSKDTAYLVEAARVLFSSSVYGTGNGNYRLSF